MQGCSGLPGRCHGPDINDLLYFCDLKLSTDSALDFREAPWAGYKQKNIYLKWFWLKITPGSSGSRRKPDIIDFINILIDFNKIVPGSSGRRRRLDVNVYIKLTWFVGRRRGPDNNFVPQQRTPWGFNWLNPSPALQLERGLRRNVLQLIFGLVVCWYLVLLIYQRNDFRPPATKHFPIDLRIGSAKFSLWFWSFV